MDFPVSLSMGVVDLLVVCGNIFVLYVLISQPSLHTSTNFLVLSLTISDLLLGTVILPFAIIQEHRKQWLFGDMGCRLWLSVDVWLSTASIYNLLAISFDRYMAVKQPIRYPSISSKRVTRLMVALVWLFSLLLASCLFVLETMDGSAKTECSPTELPSLYIIFSASASFVVPAVIMIVLNVSIFCTVLSTSRSKCVSVQNGQSMRVHRGRRMSNMKQVLERYNTEPSLTRSKRNQMAETVSLMPAIGTDSPPLPASPSDHEVSEATVRSFFSHVMVVSMISAKGKNNLMTQLGTDRSRLRFSRLSMRTELRVARTTGIVVAAFILCWLPFTTIYVLQVYNFCKVPTCVPQVLFTISFWLGYCNSAINPLLYAAFSRDFRAAFHKVLFRKSIKK